jgi:hypothetical protein
MVPTSNNTSPEDALTFFVSGISELLTSEP